MIDHTSIAVKDFAQSERFYDATLEKLGYEKLMIYDRGHCKIAGYGKDGDARPKLWIADAGRDDETIGQARGVHIAFCAKSQQVVDDWYKAALQNGGTCNGKPGQREKYHPGYYGAFVIDPNGWRIEACFHEYKK